MLNIQTWIVKLESLYPQQNSQKAIRKSTAKFIFYAQNQAKEITIKGYAYIILAMITHI